MAGIFSALSLSLKPSASLVPQCGSCGLYRHCNSPKMPVDGEGRKSILVVGEGPGFNEDRLGVPFIGKSGKFLQQALSKFDVDLRQDCWITNAIACRATTAEGKNRPPTPKEIEWCRPNITRALSELKPNVVILLGKHALKSVLSDIWKGDSNFDMDRWQGWQIPCQALNAWICPTWHPSHLLQEKDKNRYELLRMFFERALEKAVAKRNKPWKEVPHWEQCVDVIIDHKQAAERIMLMTESATGPIAFDYETQTRKPDGPHAEIYTCSMSDGLRTISYPWHGKAIEATKSFLRSGVPKIGANIKFEHNMTLCLLGLSIVNWFWDVMNTAHVIDCRPGITGLDFQAFVNLGIGKYGERVKPFLTSNGSNTPNRIKRANLHDVLLYGGIDSLLEWKVAKKQTRTLGVRWPGEE